MGVQRGVEVHVFDRITEGSKPELARALGAVYHGGSLDSLRVRPDVVIECTGASAVVFDVVNRTAPLGVVCLTGISSGGRSIGVDVGLLNRMMVLETDAVIGSVNANRRHYEAAASGLIAADPEWLRGIITRTVSLDGWKAAFQPLSEDIKVVIDFTQ
jgi:threonine dehydrogenase-like Zn-dependent dehydrogenase